MLRGEQDRLQARWIAEQRDAIYGIPLFVGRGVGGAPARQGNRPLPGATPPHPRRGA